MTTPCAPRGKRGANNRAEIVRVFNSIEQDEKPLRSLRREQVFELERRLRRRQRGDALMFAGAGQPVDLRALFKSHRNAFGPSELHHCFHALSVAAPSDHNSIERAPSRQRFLHRVKPSEPVHRSFASLARISFLIERGTEFKHALPRAFHINRKIQFCRAIEQKNHAIKLACARAA
jgi:hypothetical protein